MKKVMEQFLRKSLFYLTIVITVAYIGWRVFFTLPFNFGLFSMIAGVLLLVAEFFSAIQAIDKYGGLSQKGEPELPVIPESRFPDVDILIATHNEPRELLFKTVNACCFLRYPDRNKIHIYLCDDTDRPEMASLAEEFNIGYFGLSGNKLLKAGNINNALSKTNSPLVLTLDADMIPCRDFLVKTVPYFSLPAFKKLEDGNWVPREQDEIDPNYKIGFVQTPQSFYNADLFQFNLYSENRIPNEQDYFFREVNVNRNMSNAPIYAGTNTLISRKALEEVGYIATGTITEDFATGIAIQQKGWTTYATSTPLAHGLAPDSIDGLLNQRERWGRGCVQSLNKVKILTAKGLPWKTKFSYLNCSAYWWTFMARLVFIISPILFAVFRLRLLNCSWWQFFVFWLPYYVFYGITLRMTSGKTRNQHWNSVIDTIIFPYIAGPVLFETIGLKLEKFLVTSKVKSDEAKNTWLFALPHLLLLFTSLIALGLAIAYSLKTSAVYNIIIVFWLVVNNKNLLLAVFFMLGRGNVRHSPRFYVKLPVEFHTERGVISGQTLDISENGLAVEINRPMFIAPDSEFKVVIAAEPYSAEMRAKILHVEQRGKTWKYCALITDIDAENMRHYFQIIYDRHHSMPNRIVDNWSMFDDYSINLSKRSEPVIAVHRRLPRIETAVPVIFGAGQSGQICNFNYLYMSVKVPVQEADSGQYNQYLDSAELVVDAYPDLCFRLKYESFQLVRGTTLYYIENWAELLDSAGCGELVRQWTNGIFPEARTRNELYLAQAGQINLPLEPLLTAGRG